MEDFLTVSNYTKCKSAFFKYMNDTYDVDVGSVPVTTLRFEEVMYNAMRATVADAEPGDSIVELNNVALNRVQKEYVDRLRLVRKTKITVKSLDREQQLYGSRPTPTVLNKFGENTRPEKDQAEMLNASFDALMSNRGYEGPANGQGNSLPTEKEEPLDGNEFMNRLKRLEEARSGTDYLINSIKVQSAVPSIGEANPAALWQGPIMEQTNLVPSSTREELASNPKINIVDMDITKVEQPPLPVYVNREAQNIIPIQKPQQRFLSRRFFVINGFDRDWTQKNRYSFSISMDRMGNKYRNIVSIAFTRLIIPMEISDTRTITNTQQKYNFYHEQKFSFPYLLLQVDELQDLYDGPSQQVRKASTQFIYEQSYKCQNGRGYIVLKPAQDETPDYMNHPIASFQRLTMSILKPNGSLFNNASDSFGVFKFDYGVYNQLYMQVVLDKYFDKNEFWIGDTVMFRNIWLTPDQRAWTPPPFNPVNGTGACLVTLMDFGRLQEFINRPEGHDIIQLGEPNQNGYYKSFFIFAPTQLNEQMGKLVVDKLAMDALREFNAAFPEGVNNKRLVPDLAEDPTPDYAKQKENSRLPARVINSSLQISLSFTILETQVSPPTFTASGI